MNEEYVFDGGALRHERPSSDKNSERSNSQHRFYEMAHATSFFGEA